MPRPELRVDVLGSRDEAVHVGGGVAVPVTGYVRLAAVAGAGMAEGERASGRVEVLARMLLDPLAERRWGAFGAAGVGVRWDEGRSGRPGIVAIVGLEGPRVGPARPALELGVGDGWRVGVVLRGARAGGR